jgi:hypothetical protein
VSSLPFVVLHIREIPETITGNSESTSRAFCVLTPTLDVNGVFITFKADSIFAKMSGDINRMTIELRAPDGTLIDFGTDTGVGSPVTGSVQTTLIFEIVVIKVINAVPDKVWEDTGKVRQFIHQ